ncbi:hypothetical protein Hanom_Chr12g01163821 [Helianthus anomalus]
MDLDEDPDPETPPSGTPTHPIDISSGSSFAGSPYQGPDAYNEWWGQWKFSNTPSYHNTPPQPPLEESHFEAVTLPLPAEEPPQPPPEPPIRRRNARMPVRGGPRFSSPRASSYYPLIPEEPQMGGPSHVVPEIDVTPATFAPPPPPMGYENPIPTYPGPTRYNPFEPQAPIGYNYQPLAYDPYIEAVNYNVFILRRFHLHTQLGILFKGINTLHLNHIHNLNLHNNNNNKSCKGCKKWNVGWIAVKGTPISSLKVS